MEEFPLLQEFFNRELIRPDGAALITINGGDPVDAIRTFMSGGGYTFPVVIDPTVLTGGQVRVSQTYGITAIPVTFFIDRQGIIRHIKLGSFENADEIRTILDSIR